MAKKKVSKRWTATQAQQVLVELERSGLSERAFAKQKGLDPQRLWWWRKRLESSRDEETVAFVEVKPKAVTSTEVLEIRLLNGRVVAVEPVVLAQLLDAIEGRSCCASRRG